MPTIPDPDYDRQVAELTAAFKAAIAKIRRELLSLDLSEMSRANSTAALREVARILATLTIESATWVTKYVPEAAKEGVVGAILDLGAADSVEAAEKIAKFNRINKDLVAAVVSDTQADLLAVTQNVDRRVKVAIRKVTAESMRANIAAGINGRRTINRDTLAAMRKTLGDAVDTGIIDAAGRRWKPETYVDMVTRTKLLGVSRDARANEAVGRGAFYARISSHGATDACRKYEGMVVKLVREAPGDYRFIDDLPRNEIFHPNCGHVIYPMRDPERARR